MRNINPLDEKLIPPEQIKDRSNLTKLYEHRDRSDNIRIAGSDRRSKSIDEGRKKMKFLDMVIINLLMTIPYILSFLSITALLSLDAPSDIGTAFQHRIYTTLLTLSALLPWFFSIRILREYLWNYQMNFSTLLFIYSIFILPSLYISINLRNGGLADYIILPATFILGQIYLWLIFFAFKDGRALSLRITPFLALIVLLICLAIFI
jgi:hypothetical protein